MITVFMVGRPRDTDCIDYTDTVLVLSVKWSKPGKGFDP